MCTEFLLAIVYFVTIFFVNYFLFKLLKTYFKNIFYLLRLKTIFKSFKEQIASNKNTNWKEIKEKRVSFKTGNYPNSADYIVNALLVKKIEKEKGFAGVWELLNVGPFEKGNEKYYKTLEKLTGITKANYNEKIWELINNEK